MSLILMAKVMGIKVGNPLRKLVLLKLADNANDDGICFPSYQYIADVCEISKASARTHIEALIQMGFISKKARKNKDGSSSNLYVLHLDKGVPADSIAMLGDSTPMPADSIAMLGDSTPMPADSIGGVLADSTITSHSINQSVNHKKTTQKKSPVLELLAEFGITGQLAEDFITHRKSKSAPITKTALERLQKQADLAKLPLAEVAEIMIERGWRGFKADWQNAPQPASQKPSKATYDDNDDRWWRGKTIEIRGY
ncbi:helix-turn-helix domain-containing protein [Gallibacterium salpingitidis]|uniref:helix-turn-helix domain-containing protein n=1 Tax=Gallibacterium salpingitidis TaxID=505341 RepID=UPI00266F3AA6|nr:helix-turn-helix domain-containing protein [Gallibacterium salpingitidis]WKS98500.1 helix-turn-helix domain-containing protein [Gallibacterium salpingitidis]